MCRIRYTFSELIVGMKDSLSRTITRDDILRFAEATGDHNPIHVEEEFAAKSKFGKPIAHGMLGAGLISALMGAKLPGPGNMYMEQSLSFRKPVFIGDTITATAEITELDAEKYRVRLETVCTNQDGAVVIEGNALLHFKILEK